MKVFGIVVLCVAFAGLAYGQASIATNEGVQDPVNLLKVAGHSKQLPLPPNANPLEVKISMVVKSVFEVVEAEEEYNAQILMSLEWIDPRLDSKSPLGTKVDSSAAWDPDMQILNAISSEVRKEKIMVYPGHKVRKTKRMYLKLRAHMHYGWYPFDSHIWTSTFNSFTTDNTGLEFVVGNATLHPECTSPVFSFSGIDMAVNEVESKLVPGKTFSTVSLNIYVKRQISSFMCREFVQISSIIFVAYLSTWVSPTPEPARTGLCIVSFLTLVFINGKISEGMPKIAYITWTDCYVFGALACVGGALISFLYIHRKVTEAGKTKDNEDAKKLFMARHNHPLDVFLRTCFPIFFVIANLIFLIAAAVHKSPVAPAASD